MMVGSGIEDGENPAEAAARQVLKVTGRRGLPMAPDYSGVPLAGKSG